MLCWWADHMVKPPFWQRQGSLILCLWVSTGVLVGFTTSSILLAFLFAPLPTIPLSFILGEFTRRTGLHYQSCTRHFERRAQTPRQEV